VLVSINFEERMDRGSDWWGIYWKSGWAIDIVLEYET
jgi:hypothetical protein